MELLVGYTGFVGSNIGKKHEFDGKYNSKNIKESFDLEPDLLVYAGVTGTKFMANRNPESDSKIICSAIDNIKRINAKKLVLISTVDVYDEFGVDETHDVQKSKFSYYGQHRLELENWVRANIKDYHIVRIPALYGDNLKKNFIYDMINVVPTMIDANIYRILEKKGLAYYYNYSRDDKMYHFECFDKRVLLEYRNRFLLNDFNALSFTDSRNEYQFYNLEKLWTHIVFAINNGIRIINLVTPPVRADELYYKVYGKHFDNNLDGNPLKYNVKTKYDYLFDNNQGYIMSVEDEIEDVAKYINNRINMLMY